LINNFYPYIQEEDGDDIIAYSFISSNGAIYAIYFDPYQYLEYVNDYPILLSYGFGLGFYRKAKEGTIYGNDNLISATISQIILDFLESNPPDTVLLYHCDYKDGKQKGRNKIFNNWYTKSPYNNTIIKNSIPIYINNQDGVVSDYYLGYLTNSNNTNIDALETEFLLFAENLILNK